MSRRVIGAQVSPAAVSPKMTMGPMMSRSLKRPHSYGMP